MNHSKSIFDFFYDPETHLGGDLAFFWSAKNSILENLFSRELNQIRIRRGIYRKCLGLNESDQFMEKLYKSTF